MEKKIIDLETLTDGELLAEFADRVMAYEESSGKLHDYEKSHRNCERRRDYADLIMDNDENFCRVRECVRFIKKDDGIWEC